MKAIFVESANHFLATGEDDDMTWTPSIDKKLFRLLTCAFGGECVVSSHTFMLLPSCMLHDEHRQFIIAAREGSKSLYNLNRKHPDAVLIGGPKFLKAAYDARVIDTFIVTTANKYIASGRDYENPFKDILPKLECLCEVRIDNMVVRVYKNEY